MFYIFSLCFFEEIGSAYWINFCMLMGVLVGRKCTDIIYDNGAF